MATANILVHICCAPCAIYPVKILRSQGIKVTGFFHNPNIHPYLEFKRRLDTFKEYSGYADLPTICDADYHLREFLRMVAGREDRRCELCYRLRLTETARVARDEHYGAFSSTLLYSRFQRHSLIAEIAQAVAEEFGIPFLYYDFREGWQEGILESKALGLYRQPYCGCIYSEQERYDKNCGKTSPDVRTDTLYRTVPGAES